MNPIELFLNWLQSQDNDLKTTLSFQILSIAPRYDMQNDLSGDMLQKLQEYLRSETHVMKIAGISLFVAKAIDFFTKDYESVDAFIDSQNLLSNLIQGGEDEGINIAGLKAKHEDGARLFALKNEFKLSWNDFKLLHFNSTTIEEFMLNGLRKK